LIAAWRCVDSALNTQAKRGIAQGVSQLRQRSVILQLGDFDRGASGVFALAPINSLLYLQVSPLEGADHANHEPIVGLRTNA
jgi:hypothetical protein